MALAAEGAWRMRAHGGIMTAIQAARPLAFLSPLVFADRALAQAAGDLNIIGLTVAPSQVIYLSAIIGVTGFAVWSVIAMMRARYRTETENADLRLEIADLQVAADRAEAVINGDDQRLVVWSAPGEAPLVAGKMPRDAGAPSGRAAFLAFGTWLQPESAARLDGAVSRLRERGEAFVLTLATAPDRLIEASGRTVGSLAVVRFRDLTGDRLAHAEIEAKYQLLAAEVDAMRALLSTAPMPIWLRETDGRLVWVNAAYASAVEAADEAEAVERGLELLDSTARHMIAEVRRSTPVFVHRLPAVVAGNRRVFDVADVASQSGSAGLAADVTAIEQAQAALRREIDFNARTLDQLATAVAIFDPGRRLMSYNAAYRALFELDPAFLESRPDENAVLDRLRAARKIPEQADFRSWRDQLLTAYRSADTREQWWHLPDGQTLRVIANPNPQGGMTWIYENVTERLDLESRYNSLIQVQGETLDHLAEGVAVFGSNGRLRLHNPAFASIWGLDADFLEGRPHVAAIVAACRRPGDNEGFWTRFTSCVAGLDENRANRSGRIDRPGEAVIEYAAVPLPDGQTMVTFVDVTDSANVARALVDRNEALEAADTLKNAFIQHVSYELRSPLTNIIGFAQLLSDDGVGPLNDKQREYTGYIMSSSAALLAIINDILDLATIDAGIMELELAEVDIAATIHAAIEGVQDRIKESGIRIETQIPGDVGDFVADGKRIRQILFNLLANAIAFSPEGGRVSISAVRVDDTVEFTVSDDGPGIASDFLGSVFDRFASQPRGDARGGAGLGLSIVRSFATLHGGTVDIASEEGHGVTVKCRLPARPKLAAVAAE
jgi:signal transduction histidine kinase